MNRTSIEEVLANCRELRKVGRFAEAIERLNEAIHQVGDARLFYSRGITFDLMEEPDKAVQDLTSAIMTGPAESKYYFNRGCILSHLLGRDEEAICDFQRVLELDPNNTEAHRECCLSLLIMGRPNHALEHAEAALKLASDEADTHFCLGESYMSLMRFDEAVMSFEKAIALDSSQEHYSRALARALERQENP